MESRSLVDKPRSIGTSSKMVEATDIDWETINEKLPFERTDEAKDKRKELFAQFDPNSNGYLSLAEVDRGMRDVLQIDDLFDCKPAVQRSFHFAKKISKSGDKYGPDYLEFREFRVFLQTLRQNFEYFQAFARIDTGDDNRISKEEFCDDKIKASIEKWVGEVEDMGAEFDKIDVNGGGQILFNEFVDWALAKNLDLEDDVDP
eukprot:maker-scaffold84_size396325-snap-gene-1.14 protein:Tk09679 transcript:maker-scaffold84_size396325-snap-gene-1.14-mRNA-1 annotation:"flagellar calcium-binding protein"